LESDQKLRNDKVQKNPDDIFKKCHERLS
jgi:hypothetical protein